MNNILPHVLIIFGPTGVGKTDVSLYVGTKIPIEIINMDMGQFYTPLTIGTAKPNWRKESIPHHLFDIIATPEDYTVARYRATVLSLIKKITESGKLPVLVGGSGFYLRSLFFPPSPMIPDIPTQLISNSNGYGVDQKDLWGTLFTIDPVRAKAIHKNDHYRLKRALSIWCEHGILPSQCRPNVNIPFTYDIVYLSRKRDDLYARINERVLVMFNQGWVDEVRQLMGTSWEAFIKIKKIIGYDEISVYLNGNITLDSAIAMIQKRTRNYAKRQDTYWRHFSRELIAMDNNIGICNHLSSLPIGHLNGNNGVNEIIMRYYGKKSKNE